MQVNFRWGRTDAPEPREPKDDKRFSPDGRLPDASQHAAHLRDIFYRMGFDDRGIVALSGIGLFFLSYFFLPTVLYYSAVSNHGHLEGGRLG